MKRYRVIAVQFDTRATILGTEVQADWEPAVRESWERAKAGVREGLQHQFGLGNWAEKERDLVEIGPEPFSVVGFHNRFVRDAREAFLMGSYYSALTAATCLGERILNHLVLKLRNDYRGTPVHKAVGHESIANWNAAIDALATWHVLLPPVVDAFKQLKKLRNKAVHFDRSLDRETRGPALDALKTMSTIVSLQFGAFGTQPWFIPNATGVSFLRDDVTSQPFIREFYLPACVLVGPDHEIIPTPGPWKVVDHSPSSDETVSDEEYIVRHTAARTTRAKNPTGGVP